MGAPTKEQVVLITLLLALTLMPACHSSGSSGSCDDTGADSDSDSDTDSDTDSDSDTDTDTLLPAECPPALVPDCAETIYEFPLILAAEEIGPGYRMVDACSMAVLAERLVDDEVEIAVHARASRTEPFGYDHEVATLITGAGHARAIAGQFYVSFDEGVRYLVLVCDEAGACGVHRVIDVGGEPMDIEPEPTWSFPAQYSMRAMSWFEDPPVVVIGNGAVSVWNGDLYGLMPADTGAPFNDGAAYQYLVGGEGRLVRNNGYEWSYTELESGTVANLLAADYWDEGLIVAADDGTLGSGEEMPLDWLLAADEAIVEVAANEWGDEYHAITQSGCVLAREYLDNEDGPCVYGVMPEPGTRVFYWDCWDIYNVSFLAPGGLYGFWDCIHFY